MTEKASPGSPVLKNCINAFLFGGGICVFGQLLNTLFTMADCNEKEVAAATPCASRRSCARTTPTSRASPWTLECSAARARGRHEKEVP